MSWKPHYLFAVFLLMLCGLRSMPAQSVIVFTIMGSLQSAGDTGAVTVNFSDNVGNNYSVTDYWSGPTATASSIASDLATEFVSKYPLLTTASGSGATGASFGVQLTGTAGFTSYAVFPSMTSGQDFYPIFDVITAPLAPSQPPPPPGTQGIVVTQASNGSGNGGSITISGTDPASSDPESQYISQEMQSVTPVAPNPDDPPLNPDGSGCYGGFCLSSPDLDGNINYTVKYADGSSIGIKYDDSAAWNAILPGIVLELMDYWGGPPPPDPYSSPCGY